MFRKPNSQCTVVIMSHLTGETERMNNMRVHPDVSKKLQSRGKVVSTMTLENILSHVGMGSKRLTERYSEYPAPGHDQPVYYAYEPTSPGHGYVHTGTKHNYSSGLKTNASMSALTLLAFLFFLHILQQCIKEHMNDMGASPIMVMTAGKEGEANIAKSVDKMDKSGVSETTTQVNKKENRDPVTEKYDAKNPFQNSVATNKKRLTKIPLAEKLPTGSTRDKYQHIYKHYNENQSPVYGGFTSETNEDGY